MKKAFKIAGIIVAVLALAAIVMYGIVLFKTVTPEQAQQKSREHFNDVKAKITAVSGYEIVKESKPSVNVIEDEMGSKDYSLSASFLVRNASDVTGAGIKSDIEAFAKSLATNDYGILVENMPPASDGRALMCVSASRYLNNDGAYIPQGSTAIVGRYITDEEFSTGYISACTELVQ